MRNFIIKIISAIVILAIIVIGMNKLYIHMDKKDPDYTRKFRSIPNEIQICNTGSSHGLYGFYYEDLALDYNSFNFGLQSQSLLYDKRILEYYQDNLAEDAVVFIPVSYFVLYGQAENLDSDFISKNQRYYKILPRKLITDYDAKTAILQKYPILSSYENIANVFLGRSVATTSSWETQTADDIDLSVDVEAAYNRHIVRNKFDENGNRIINYDNLNSLYEIIELCNEIEVRPVLVTTPFLREYTDAIQKGAPEFFDEFYELLDDVIRKTGVEYYDYSKDERFLDDHSLFMNGDHLNKSGATYFSKILLEEIVNNNK